MSLFSVWYTQLLLFYELWNEFNSSFKNCKVNKISFKTFLLSKKLGDGGEDCSRISSPLLPRLWERNGSIIKNGVLTVTTLLFWKFCFNLRTSHKEFTVFDVPTSQMSIFVLFVGAGVLFGGAYLNDIHRENQRCIHFSTRIYSFVYLIN